MSPYEIWISFYTILTREVRRFMRIWVQTLVPPVITAGLYFLIFGALIGPRIGPMAGFTYMEFVAPGLIMLAVITNAYANVTSSFFGAKMQRHLEEVLVSPMPLPLALAGFVFGGVMRGLLVGVLVMALASLFVDLHFHNLWVMASILFLTSLLFSLFGFVNGIFARNFDDISVIPTFVLTPLIYLGGVFYSIELLPSFWALLSMLNPILYMVNAFRYGLLGVSDINLGLAFGMVLLFVVLAYACSLWLLRTSLRLRQ